MTAVSPLTATARPNSSPAAPSSGRSLATSDIGDLVGDKVGVLVGLDVGFFVGLTEGLAVVGLIEGLEVGFLLGLDVFDSL